MARIGFRRWCRWRRRRRRSTGGGRDCTWASAGEVLAKHGSHRGLCSAFDDDSPAAAASAPSAAVLEGAAKVLAPVAAGERQSFVEQLVLRAVSDVVGVSANADEPCGRRR